VHRLDRLRPYGTHAADLAVVALAMATEIEIWNSDLVSRPWALSLLAPLMSLPLLLRRRYPVVATMTVLVAVTAMAFVDATGTNDLDTLFLAILVTSWSIGAHNDKRHAVAGLIAVWVATGIVTHRFPEQSVADTLWPIGFFTATWLAGFVLSRRTEHNIQLQELAARLQVEREDEARQAVQEERARIARELHDVVAHSVSVMVVQAGGVRRLLRDDQAREREALLVVEQIGRSALTEMRRMLGVLRTEGETATPALTPQPGLAYLDRLLDQVRQAGLDVDLHVVGEPRTMPQGVDLSAYRIVQEGLTNALKHAGGGRADVTVRYGETSVELEVADDGLGAPEEDGMGHGLVGMQERVALYGGTLEAGPRDEGGYLLRAMLPWDGAAAAQ
jgi:signal transduction histidine kinase